MLLNLIDKEIKTKVELTLLYQTYKTNFLN